MQKEYPKDDITVIWNPEKCSHSAICAKGLPSVFRPKEKPWIQTEHESKEKIREQVLKCPSGALSLK